MRRAIATAVPLPAGPDHGAVLRDDPALWLPDARPQGLRRWRFELAALGLTRAVVCDVSRPVVTRSGPSRRLSWEPLGGEADLLPSDRWLPGFSGEVRVVGAPQAPSVVLAGHVLLPLGLVGAALDSLALGSVADRSLDDLLRRIAANIADVATERLTGSADVGRAASPAATEDVTSPGEPATPTGTLAG